MKLIAMRLPNFSFSNISLRNVLNFTKNRLDKISKNTLITIAIVAISIFAILAARYGGKLMSKIKTSRRNYFDQKRKDLCEKGDEISLNQARQIGKNLVLLKLTAKSMDDLIEYFRICPNIERIYLKDCPITKDLLKKLSKNVKILELISCSFSHSSFEGLKFLSPHLKEMNLRDCDLQGVVFDGISHHLKALYIALCKNVALDCFSVKKLHLTFNSNFSLNYSKSSIKELCLWNTKDLLLDDLHLLGDLKKLKATHCEKLPLDSLPDGLESLELHECSLQNPALNFLPKNLKYLEIVSCVRKPGLDGLSLDHLPQNLQILSLEGGKMPSLNHLPTSLKKLLIRGSDLTRGSLDHLPDSLTSVGIQPFPDFVLDDPTLLSKIDKESLPFRLHNRIIKNK